MVAMTIPDAVPQRLSFAERDAAVAALRAHLDAGRLDADEFAERSTIARDARTATEIEPLFGDLPQPHPAYLAAVSPTWNTYPGASGPAPAASGLPRTQAPEPGSPASQQAQIPTYSGTVLPYGQGPAPVPTNQRWIASLHGIIWPVAIILFVTGHGGWWLFIAAIVLSSLLGGAQRRRRQPPPY